MTEFIGTFRKEGLVEVLKESITTVTFTKKDGTVRVMRCTLAEKLLPVLETKADDALKNTRNNPEVVSVFDLEKKAWRSFRVESVTKIVPDFNV